MANAHTRCTSLKGGTLGALTGATLAWGRLGPGKAAS
jgi:hypothetical protein